MFDAPSFAPIEAIHGSGDVRAVSYGSDKGLFVEFRSEPIYNEFQSKASGKATYDTRVMVRIYTPGDKTKVVDRIAKLTDEEGMQDVPTDPQRWPLQWAAFQNGVKAEMEGTPLSQWPMITRQQVQEFNAFNIYTVEQLSEVSDVALDGLGHGGRSLRDGAIAWLSQARDDGAIARIQAQHEQEMQALKDRMDGLMAMLEEKTEPDDQRRGPGRPRKEAA
jgi:hypothetical protein